MEKTSVVTVDANSGAHRGFFDRMSIYGFEFFMALFGLLTTLVVVDYGIFALFNYLRTMTGLGVYVGELTIWVVAAMIVWLPVTVVFYLRSRSESERNPLHRESMVHKVFLSVYFISVIFGGIGLAFAAIYALVNLAVNPDGSVVDTLVRIVAPAVIAAGLHVGMMFAFPKKSRPTRVTFISIFGIFAALVAGVLLIISIGYVRGSKQDDVTVTDLYSLQSRITTYYYQNNAIPEQLSAALDVSSGTRSRFDRYTYTKVDPARYVLCATFMTDTTTLSSEDNMISVSSKESEQYSAYANFDSHAKGYVCFDLKASGYESFSAEPVIN